MRVHAFVAGVVQGVWFRYFVAREARRLGLAGFVRNLPDGRVEVVAEGERAALERLVAAFRTGPPSAEVQDVRVEWSDAPDRGGDFLIR